MLKHTQPRLSQLASAVAVVLGGITLLPAAHAAAPAAGSSISNIASASYTDATGASQTVTSNEVRTTVIQVASFTLVDARTALATPNSTVNLSHTLTNTGNGTDTFTIALANLAGDDINLNGLQVYIDANGDGIPDNTTNVTSVTLAPGESVNLIVVGTTPVDALAAQQAQVTISATTAQPLAPSQQVANGGLGATVTNTDTVTITGGGVISVVKSANVATVNMSSEAGRTITYTLRYTNSGNATATDVVLTDVLPANVAYRAGFTTWSNAAGNLTEASGDDIFTLDPATNTLTFSVGSVPANTTGTLTFQVIVDEDAPVGDVVNVAQFEYDPDGLGGQDPVDPADTNQVPVEVPANRTGSINDSTNDPFADGEAAGGGAIVSPTDTDGAANDEQTIASIAQGASATFRTYVHNTGNLEQVFEVVLLNQPAGATVQLFQADGVTPLTNIAGTTAVDVGPIPVGGIREVVVVVSLPNTTSGDNLGAGFVTEVAVRPVGAAAGVQDTTTLTIDEVLAARVDLHNNNAAVDNNLGTDQSEFGEGVTGTDVIDTETTTPTNAVTFPLGVFNGSNSPDNFNLTVPNLPAGWTAVFLDANGNAVTNTGNIPANTEASLTVVVTPPAGTLVGDYPLDFVIASPVSGLTDTMRNQVTVTEVRQLSLVPNRTGQVAPGGTIVYSHTLTNNGNTTEGAAAQGAEGAANSGLLLAIAQAGGAGTFTGNVTVAVDLNNNGLIEVNEIVTGGDLNQRLPAGLIAGASATILVQVQAPTGALPGQENSTTITVNATTAINGVAAPAAVQVLDVTTVTAGQIRLLKTQAVDANCDGVADGAYGNGVISAQPGQCVVYRIVATNEGNAAVTAVVITDATPAFTTISTAAVATVGTITAPVLAAGDTGTVTNNVGPLAPAATAQLDFGVQIDD